MVEKRDFEKVVGPTSVFAICTEFEDGAPLIVPFNWVMLRDYSQRMVSVFAKNDSFTLGNIKRDEEFVLCRPENDPEVAQKLVMTTKWRGDKRKSFKANIEMEDWNGQAVLKNSVMKADCQAIGDYIRKGDHTEVVGSVEEVAYEQGRMDESLLYYSEKTFGACEDGLFEVEGY